jgi:hypothetical protein
MNLDRRQRQKYPEIAFRHCSEVNWSWLGQEPDPSVDGIAVPTGGRQKIDRKYCGNNLLKFSFYDLNVR